MNLKPLGDRVVVEREEAKDTTAGGIVLPDTAKDKPQKGKVVAVGDGRITKDGKRRELQVKVGDAGPVHLLCRRRVQDRWRQEGAPDARGRHPRGHRLRTPSGSSGVRSRSPDLNPSTDEHRIRDIHQIHLTIRE